MIDILLAAAISTTGFTPYAPTDFQFGGDVAAHDFNAMCATHTERELDPSELPLATTRHVQVDCEGYEYFGSARLAEFVFADGALTHVWVLVHEAELDALQSAFEAEFGSPDAQAPVFSAFFDNRAAVRRDIPEALYYGEAAAPLFEAFFSQ
ncbi:MAG: hypothetical protein DHS20C06_02550 [Hyphobacterium sp.]|nr:MAG: hypothetical protein DHS20C06_02550 [Hyphobacterium sp.]